MVSTLLEANARAAISKAAEKAYIQLNALLIASPNLCDVDERLHTPDETLKWLGEVSAVVSTLNSTIDNMELSAATSHLISSQGGSAPASKIKLVLYRCIALAQQRSPATAQSAFIATGADFDAFAALQRIFQHAKSSVLIVDPYMDESVLLSFAVLVGEKVSIALLSDESGIRPALKPAADTWIAQYGTDRPLAVRVAPKRTLHDRIILIDNTEAWILTQSLKDFAARSPATIQKVDPQLAAMKFEAYSDIWKASTAVAE
jgi:hypothetical protein